MGGSHETRLPGSANLRIHESGGNAHVHDDVRGTKFVMPTKQFKKGYQELKKKLQAAQPPFKESLNDANDVRLVGELDQDAIEWRLEVGTPVAVQAGGPSEMYGFDELDSFVGQL